MKKVVVILLSLWVLSATFIPRVVGEDPSLEDPPIRDISFQPNVIPFTEVYERVGKDKDTKELNYTEGSGERFRFEWLNNTFDIELFFNATYEGQMRLFSLRDLEDDFNVTVKYVANRNESMVQFGWLIENVSDAEDFIHNAWFKIEDSSFDYNTTILEEIEVFVNETTGEPLEQSYNITRFHLPDNLILSFEDLYHKGFIIGHQNKTSTSVKGFSGKSSWDLDPIVESGGIITITDYPTEGSPCDLDEIWTQIGNETIFAKHNDVQYSSSARIVLGNGTTAGEAWLIDTNKQLTFNASAISAHYQRLIMVEGYGHLRFGSLLDATDKLTKNGVALISLDAYLTEVIRADDATSDVWLYSSYLIRTSQYGDVIFRTNNVFYNNVFDQVRLRARAGGQTCDVYDLTVKNVATTDALDYPSGTFDRLLIHDNKYGVRVASSYATSLNNGIFKRQTTAMIWANAITTDKYLIDCESDSWNFYWQGTSTANILRQYTFDLTVTYPNGTAIQNANVTVSHYGQGESQDFTELTDASGQISQKTLSMGFYNQTGGNTIYSYNPYNIEITYPSMPTYTKNFTLDEKTEWTIALQTETDYNWFAATIIIGIFACFMTIYALTGKT